MPTLVVRPSTQLRLTHRRHLLLGPSGPTVSIGTSPWHLGHPAGLFRLAKMAASRTKVGLPQPGDQVPNAARETGGRAAGDLPAPCCGRVASAEPSAAENLLVALATGQQQECHR